MRMFIEQKGMITYVCNFIHRHRLMKPIMKEYNVVPKNPQVVAKTHTNRIMTQVGNIPSRTGVIVYMFKQVMEVKVKRGSSI